MTFIGLCKKVCDLGYDVDVMTQHGTICAEITCGWSHLNVILIKDGETVEIIDGTETPMDPGEATARPRPGACARPISSVSTAVRPFGRS